MAGRKFQIVNVSLYIVKEGYSYLCMWMTPNWLERNKILIRAQCETSKDVVDNYRTMFESRISAGTQKFPYSENFRISSWFHGMEGHAKYRVERYCELANKTTQQLYKVFCSMLVTNA